MTTKAIAEQIDVIRDATAKAIVSKESAAAFLARAGISKVQVVSKRALVAANISQDEATLTPVAGKSLKRRGHLSITVRSAKKKAK